MLPGTEEVINDVLLGVVSSLLAIPIIGLLTFFRLHSGRLILRMPVARWLDHHIERTFTHQGTNDASRAIQRELMRAQDIRIIALRGQFLAGPIYAPMFNPDRPPRILLPDPAPRAGLNWVQVRQNELHASAPEQYSRDGTELQNEIMATITTLNSKIISGVAHLRLHSGPVVAGLVLTERRLFLTVTRSEHVEFWHSPLYETGPGAAHDYFSRLFEVLWSTGRTP